MCSKFTCGLCGRRRSAYTESDSVVLRVSKRPLKILLLGDSSTGKTKLVKRFMNHMYNDDIEDDLVDLQQFTVTRDDGSKVPIVIYDSPAGDHGVNVNKNMYSNADVILLCFDVCDKKTLASVKNRWIPELKSADCARNYQFMLVGLKTDDRERRSLYGSRRGHSTNTVPTAVGQSVHEEIKSCVYLECSSKTGEGVKNVFDVAYLLARQRKTLGKSWFMDFDIWNSKSHKPGQ